MGLLNRQNQSMMKVIIADNPIASYVQLAMITLFYFFLYGFHSTHYLQIYSNTIKFYHLYTYLAIPIDFDSIIGS